MGEGEEVERVLHAATAACPVAVVEFEAFALEDEGTDAVLRVDVLDGLERKGWFGGRVVPALLRQNGRLEAAFS